MHHKKKYSLKQQYLISIVLIGFTASISFLLVDLMGYRVVAFILLLEVSVVAMVFDIFPVLLTSFLSAIIWNFFFIPPIFTFHIDTPENGLMFLMYFMVALINAVLTFKIREYEQKANRQAEKEKSIQLYNTLFNSLSHELRTPIAAIMTAIDTIQDQEIKISEGSRKELYQEIEIASLRLNRQVKNLLNMSRIEAGNLRPKLDWCDLNELIHDLIKQLSELSGNHELFFHHNEQLPLYKTDRGLLEQICYNLLHNAIQHNPPPSEISISLSGTQQEFTITISDNGNGFPERDIDLVFDKFYRVSASASKGIGLGLSIVKGYTEALEGTIQLDNLSTGGAKFVLRIPAQATSNIQVENE